MSNEELAVRLRKVVRLVELSYSESFANEREYVYIDPDIVKDLMELLDEATLRILGLGDDTEHGRP